MPQFDPAVFTENGMTYLYSGFCMPQDNTRSGATVTVLGADMLTVVKAPVVVAPSKPYAHNTTFEHHAYYEAPSLRKISRTYYFIYSSVQFHQLCYATAPTPLGPFCYGGVIVSNSEIGIDSYKPAQQPMFYGANNHGSIIQIAGQWYVFYHRHTNGTNFSRQGCIEPIEICDDGAIIQAEMTSCGANGAPLKGQGEYAAHIACNLFCVYPQTYTGGPGDWMDCRYPKITQDAPDGVQCGAHIANLRDGATAGFKYFNCMDICKITVRTRGNGGVLQVKTAWDGAPLGEIVLQHSNEWKEWTAEICIPNGIWPLYFTYCGDRYIDFAAFSLHKNEI